MATKSKKAAVDKKSAIKDKTSGSKKTQVQKQTKLIANSVKKTAKSASNPIKSKPTPNNQNNSKSKLSKVVAKVESSKVTINKLPPIVKEEQKVISTPHLENKKIVNKLNIKPVAPAPTVPNTKTRYADTELAEFKAVIDEKLVVARQELNYLQEQIVEMNENNADIQGSDWFDDSSIHAEVELLNNMAIRQRQFIQNLDNALVRIENKSYGICSINGTLIDKKRLMLVPHATKSIEAKHIEQASMIPEINQVAPDERVLRRTAEGKPSKKSGAKKVKSKSSREFEDEDGEEMIEAPAEDLDIAFEGGDD